MEVTSRMIELGFLVHEVVAAVAERASKRCAFGQSFDPCVSDSFLELAHDFPLRGLLVCEKLALAVENLPGHCHLRVYVTFELLFYEKDIDILSRHLVVAQATRIVSEGDHDGVVDHLLLGGCVLKAAKIGATILRTDNALGQSLCNLFSGCAVNKFHDLISNCPYRAGLVGGECLVIDSIQERAGIVLADVTHTLLERDAASFCDLRVSRRNPLPPLLEEIRHAR